MYPHAYIEFLHYFHCDRDYFECHEVLEDHWKEKPAKERELHWVGLIQIAVGLYHHRRGNLKGAERMLQNAVKIIQHHRQEIKKLALDDRKLTLLLDQQLTLIRTKQPYRSVDLPIIDPSLLKACQQTAMRQNKVWGAPSDLTNETIIHKHTARNREEVINERLKQLMIRKQNKR